MLMLHSLQKGIKAAMSLAHELVNDSSEQFFLVWSHCVEFPWIAQLSVQT